MIMSIWYDLFADNFFNFKEKVAIDKTKNLSKYWPNVAIQNIVSKLSCLLDSIINKYFITFLLHFLIVPITFM